MRRVVELVLLAAGVVASGASAAMCTSPAPRSPPPDSSGGGCDFHYEPSPSSGGCGTGYEARYPVCGNSERESGEVCDGADLGGFDCASLGFGPGPLACRLNCTDYDRTACGAPTTCGNGARELAELCDGDDLDGYRCGDLGRQPGTLRCLDNCADFDASGCGPPLECGNGVLELPAEVCDGDDFGGRTCGPVDGGGWLRCAADCLSVDTSGCGARDGGIEDSRREDGPTGDVPHEDRWGEDQTGPCGQPGELPRCEGANLMRCVDGLPQSFACASLGTGFGCGVGASGDLGCVGALGAQCVDPGDCAGGLTCSGWHCAAIRDAGHDDSGDAGSGEQSG